MVYRLPAVVVLLALSGLGCAPGSRTSPSVAVLTDYGSSDAYVGVLSGAILSHCPDARIVTITNEVPDFDIDAGSFLLGIASRAFPPGTVFCVVVDPGVGGARKPLLVKAGNYLFVGPDNGCFTLVLKQELKQEQEVQAYELVEQRYHHTRMSQTFHGRDIFAPAAAYLSLGTAPAEIGSVVDCAALTRLAIPESRLEGKSLHGEIIWVDSFGNLITNISEEDLEGFALDSLIEIEIKGKRIKSLKQSYEKGKVGEIVCLWGSAGLLEIALKERNLHLERGWGRGEKVWVRKKK